MTKKHFFFVLILFSFQAIGQTDSVSKSLDEIIVTANRFPQKQINTGKILTVITREQIEKTPNANLAELLSRQAGLSVIGASNAPGTNPDVYIRGAGTGNALILIDGSPATDASTIRSTFDLNFIPLGEVERIEILKGGQSTIYGSDAVAGVINIITKKNSNKKVATSLHIAGGSYQTSQLDLGVYGKFDRIQYKGMFHQLGSKGFSSAIDTGNIKSFDKDGMNQRVFRAELGSIQGMKWDWSTSAQLSKYNNQLDQTGYQDAKDSKVDNSNLQLRASLSKKINIGSIHTNFSINNNERNYLDDSTDLNGFAKYIQSDFVGRSYFSEVYGVFKLDPTLQLYTGFDYRWQNTDQYYFSVSEYGDYSSTLSSDSTKITIGSFFGSMVYNGKKNLNMEAGIRVNNHSRFGNNFTYTINPSYLLNKQFKFSLNISSAFKAPTLYQLYDGYAGEKSLKPETSVTSEFSLQFLGIKNTSARVVYFNRQIKNGIDYSYSTYKYFNYASQKDNGIEVETGYSNSKLNLSINYTYIKGTINTANYAFDANTYSYTIKGDTSFPNLFRIPKHSINGSIGFQMNKKVYMSLAQRIVGNRFEPQFQAPSIALKAFQTTDLFFQYKLGKKASIYLSLKNIFNTSYQEVLGFNARRRNYMIGLRM